METICMMERLSRFTPPNPPMHPTPLRGPKIAAILKAGIDPTAFPFYQWRRG
jgi:hypothetical protein